VRRAARGGGFKTKGRSGATGAGLFGECEDAFAVPCRRRDKVIQGHST